MTDDPLVSVIVPTFNSGNFLDKCLCSIEAQTYGNIEAIVVDNYSMDKTREIAEKHQAKVVLLNGIRSKARNIGLKAAKSDFIFSIDSDMVLTPNTIAECVAIVQSGFDAVIVAELSVGEGFWAKCKALEKSCYIGDNLIEAARFFRKETLDAVNGYDRDLEFGEDWDLTLRIRKLGYRIARTRAHLIHQEGKLRLKDSVLKKRHYSKTYEAYRRKHPEEAKSQLQLIRPAFVRNWRKLAIDPMHALGMIFMKTCEFVFAGFPPMKADFDR
jgi:glycosyltransferase involved in cell wall biosynthesis